MKEPRELMLLSRAQSALSEARTIDEVKDLRDKAAAVQAYARKAKLGHSLVVEASAIKVRAERKLGQMLQTLDLARAAPGNQHTGSTEQKCADVRLTDLGISKTESSRSQRIASLPDDTFEQFVAEHVEDEREPTTAGLLRLAKRLNARPTRPPVVQCGGRVVGNLRQLIDSGLKFATIYADPPWAYNNQGTRGATNDHYPTMTIDEICDEPVARLCQDQGHLHLWTTNGFLLEAFDVIEAWGFTFKSAFIWVKPQIGIGNYWRVSHEFLLLGVRGNLPFQDKGQRSWLESERTEHSRKPDIVRQIVETVSPGPYLEMYGRQDPTNDQWTVYGNQLPSPSHRKAAHGATNA